LVEVCRLLQFNELIAVRHFTVAVMFGLGIYIYFNDSYVY